MRIPQSDSVGGKKTHTTPLSLYLVHLPLQELSALIFIRCKQGQACTQALPSVARLIMT